MTTGRINQITILRRGRPAGASFSAGEISKLPGRRPPHRRVAPLPRRAGLLGPGPAAGIPLSPSQFPRAGPSAAQRPARGVRRRRPRRGTHRAASAARASAARGRPLSLRYGVRGQRPAAH